MNELPMLATGPDVSPEVRTWVSERLPELPSLWQAGPLKLVRQDPAAVAADQSIPNAFWRTITFLPGWSVDVHLPDEHTLITRSPQGGCRLSSLDGLTLAYWGDEPRTALFLAVIEAIRSRNVIMLHACGYVASGDTSLTAVVGRSGSGKSTHLLHQLASGARPVAEDTLWVDIASGFCTSQDRHVRLLPGNAYAQTQAAISQTPADGGPKHLWNIAWERQNSNTLPRLGEIRCLRQFEPRPLNSLPMLAQVQYLWEAIGQPLLPSARRSHQKWVQDTLRISTPHHQSAQN